MKKNVKSKIIRCFGVCLAALIILFMNTVLPAENVIISQKVSAISVLPTPDGFTSSVSGTSVKLRWDSVPDATGYIVLKYDESSKRYISYKKVKGTTCTIKGLKSGKTYYFKVKAYKSSMSSTIESGETKRTICNISSGITGLHAEKISKNSITFKWDKTDGASYYEYECERESFSDEDFEEVCEVIQTKDTTVTVKSLDQGVKYTFRVYAYDQSEKQIGEKAVISVKTKGTRVTPPKAPKNLRVTNTTIDSAKIEWSAVSGASGYCVYFIDNNGGYYLIGETKDTSVLITDLEPGKTYKYCIVSVKLQDEGKQTQSSWTSSVKVTTPNKKKENKVVGKGNEVVVNGEKIILPRPSAASIPEASPENDNDREFSIIGKADITLTSHADSQRECEYLVNRYIKALEKAGLTVKKGKRETGHDEWAIDWYNDGYDLYYKDVCIGYMNVWYGHHDAYSVMVVVGVKYTNT